MDKSYVPLKNYFITGDILFQAGEKDTSAFANFLSSHPFELFPFVLFFLPHPLPLQVCISEHYFLYLHHCNVINDHLLITLYYDVSYGKLSIILREEWEAITKTIGTVKYT